MKKIIAMFLTISLLNGCGNMNDKELVKSKGKNENKISLAYVDGWNEIELAHTDDRYGEWGGDSDIIIIYSDGKTFFADYSRYFGSTKPLTPPSKTEKPKKWYEYKKLDFKLDSIKLDDDGIGLVEKAIFELAKFKIKNESSISHSGNLNSVISRDSSLIIEDFPSGKWLTFQKLKTKLTAK